jgi:hypothetical protein
VRALEEGGGIIFKDNGAELKLLGTRLRDAAELSTPAPQPASQPALLVCHPPHQVSIVSGPQ